ncbi:MAG: calcium-translocating P-type ATPase, PMCA-type [Oscillospiraceae bacterium]|nr:calcium-translocating P-type ATPase, PMCA-type [Oscillospiraceae bacterium]
MEYYLESSEAVLEELKTTEQGLSSHEAAERLQQQGKNRLAEEEKRSVFRKFLDSITDPMILMLLGAALVQVIVTILESKGSFTIGSFTDVFVILSVVIINAIMSLVQENKAEAAMAALMQMTADTSKVMRDGTMITVKSEDLVVGDVVCFEAGDTVPADCRVLEAHSLKAEEAALTGEALAAEKLVDVLMCAEGQNSVPLGDRSNMLYSGSTVVYGRGKGVVTATGMDTEMGKIAGALRLAEKEQTPLQRRMAELSVFLTKLVIGICIVVFAVGCVQSVVLTDTPFSWNLLGTSAVNSLVAAIALAVAAIPEGMPAVVTIVLSIGVTEMAKHQALIRKLTAVETLGCTQIICSDKTGTLTQNKMTVVQEYTCDSELMATAMALCSDAEIRPGESSSVGEPTEAALVNYAMKLGLPKYELVSAQPRVAEAPFDSMRKMMSTVHRTERGFIQYTKGACDMLLERCTGYLKDGRVIPMTAEILDEVRRVNKSYADQALRVLAAAYRAYDTLPEDTRPESLEQSLILIGLYGMIDPCRPEVYDAIEKCRAAGIRPIMITGDHKDTAVAIGKDLGIIRDEREAVVGAELDQYTDEELVEVVERFSVYARVQPEHKTRIVDAWQARGKITAMTGDGVNDAPSIKAADIGIGMGITGTPVTKSAADMVLADDNFATIVRAIEAGRKIYDNICKVLQFQLSTNLAEVLIVFFASILNFTILTPVHLLWINMVTDTLPGLALGMEKAEGELMKRKPRPKDESIFANGAGVSMLWQGAYLAAIEIAAYYIGYYLENGSFTGIANGSWCENAVVMVFLTVSFAEMMCALNMRSRTGSIFRREMLQNVNWWMIGALVITVGMTVAAAFLPGFKELFGIHGTLTSKELLISVGLALSTLPVFEAGKALHRLGNKAALAGTK